MADVKEGEINKLLFKEFSSQQSETSEYYISGGDVHRKVVTQHWSYVNSIKSFLFEVFLPQGYPDSVSDDYTWYQVWDTLQACCSTLSGMLAVQAVLMGVGVGRDNATPLAAALAWFTKDGIGMVTGISFAWLKGTSLDSECKKWRLFADFINDVALCIELSISTLLDKAVPLLCLSSALKAIVGVAGGATRAALTHHQATQGNTADVAAKDGSQETLVNLTAMSAGIWLINTYFIQQNIWVVMFILVLAHIYFNYRAVKSLRLRKFNEERYVITLRSYLLTNQVPSVTEVNVNECVILGTGISAKTFCGFSIKLGRSLKGCKIDGSVMQTAMSQQNGRYMLIPNGNDISVAMHPDITQTEVLKAYFHAVIIASLLNLDNLNIPPSCPLEKLAKETEKYEMSKENRLKAAVLCSAAVIDKQFLHFKHLCEAEQWVTNEHVLRVDQWRVQWQEKALKMA